MSEREETIPLMVQWSFAVPASKDMEKFLSDLKKYNEEIVSEMSVFNPFRIQNYIGRIMLGRNTRLEKLIVNYEYTIETQSGEWEVKRNTVVINPGTGSLKVGELIYYIHHSARSNLADQDHCFLEELYLSEDDSDEGIPVYELFLGS